MASSKGQIEFSSYGTADFVSEVEVVREATFGGFRVMLLDGEKTILVEAVAWTGTQPRAVIDSNDVAAFRDWMEVIEASGRDSYRTLRFVGSKDAARDSLTQWKTHGPSPILGDPKAKRVEIAH